MQRLGSIVAFGAAWTSLLALSACEDMFSITPYERIGAFEMRTDMRDAHLFLSRLANQYGMELHGGLYGEPRSVPPVASATILTGDCMLLAKKRGPALVVSLNVVQGKRCPERMRTIFDEARRGLARRPKRA